MNHLREVDWKLVLVAFITCYMVPWAIVGTALLPLLSEGETAVGWSNSLAGGLVAITFLAAPAVAGYFTAKYAKNRPRLHALLVVLFGACASAAISKSSPPVQLAIAAISAALGAAGAFLVLRGPQR